MLENKKVAGTVILQLGNGAQKFLVQKTEIESEFKLVTFIGREHTGLANMLLFLKETVKLNVACMDLVDLTNGTMDKERVPFFVFETKEIDQMLDLPNGYSWEEPKAFRQVIENFHLEGMPMF